MFLPLSGILPDDLLLFSERIYIHTLTILFIFLKKYLKIVSKLLNLRSYVIIIQFQKIVLHKY